VGGASSTVCSEADFIGQRGRGAGWPAWSRHGGHGRAPVATVVFAVWKLSAGVGVTSVARWLGLMTVETTGKQWCLVDVVGATFFRVSWSGSGQGEGASTAG
jgi:hypothetical protein